MKFIRPTKILDTGAFSRASTGTYIGADGVMQTAGVDVPRIDYDPVMLECKGLLIEEARTNLLTYSQEFDNVAWTKTISSVTPNATTAPDGTTTAEKLDEATTATADRIIRSTPLTITASATYTASVYVKASGRGYAQVRFENSNGTFSINYVTINLSTLAAVNSGTVAGTFVSASATAVGNGWIRIAVTGVLAANVTTASIGIYSHNGTTTNYAGVVGTGIYVWGAQLEVGSTPTSYIPTTTAAVTREADIITGSGLIYSTVPETDYTAWNAATNYTVGTRVMRAVSGVHKNFENLIAGVNATLPELATTGATPRWLELGPTNRWACFDGVVGTSTSATDSLTIVLTTGRFNSLALMQVDASLITVDLTVDAVPVYSAEINMTTGNNVGDWYQYFYEPVYQQDALVITDLVDASLLDIPAYSEGVMTVTLSKTSGTVSLGALIVGMYAELGDTQYQPTIGIVDYSRKEVDAFGRVAVTPRAYSKRMTAKVAVMKADIDNVSRLLAQYRSTPLVWVGAGNLYTSMIIFGFYKDWEISIDNYSFGNLSLQVEGLT